MLVEFRRVHRTLGTTMIYVTHDQEEALVMSDRIGVMNHGRLVAVGSPRELYENPRDPFVAEFLGETNLLPGTAVAPDTVRLDGGANVAVQHDVAAGDAVLIVVRPEKIAVLADALPPPGWNRLSGTVEDVVYVGEATKYRVRSGAGQVVRVKQLNHQPSPCFEVGRDVVLCWHAADCHVLPGRRPSGDDIVLHDLG